ncbi:MAG: nitroreductase family deazaflavin-dependent oxidoreductase [Candidatus Thorarchaeota archaeon]
MSEFPREGSVVYKINNPGSKTIGSFKTTNKLFMVPFYRLRILPLFGIGRVILLLYHIGRKSGKKYITPVEYLKKENIPHIFASRGYKTDWLKNIKKSSHNIKIQMGFKTKTVDATIITDDNEYNELFKFYVKKRTKPAKSLFGWDPSNDNPETTNFSLLKDKIVAVKLLEK